MGKVIFIIIIIGTLIGSIATVKYLSSRKNDVTTKATQTSPSPGTSENSTIPAAITEERIANIEKAINFLEDKFSTSTGTVKRTTTNKLATQDAAAGVTDGITDLQKRVAKLEQGTTTTAPASKVPQYIPLGISGAASTTDWSTINNIEIDINSTDYPGVKHMVLEVSLRVYQGNGTAFARLFNTTDGTAVLSSEASTTKENYTWVTSPNFTLPSGSKHYKMQLKTTTGYEASVQSARIKVVF